jgi:hypothetical protein
MVGQSSEMYSEVVMEAMVVLRPVAARAGGG